MKNSLKNFQDFKLENTNQINGGGEGVDWGKYWDWIWSDTSEEEITEENYREYMKAVAGVER